MAPYDHTILLFALNNLLLHKAGAVFPEARPPLSHRWYPLQVPLQFKQIFYICGEGSTSEGHDISSNGGTTHLEISLTHHGSTIIA